MSELNLKQMENTLLLKSELFTASMSAGIDLALTAIDTFAESEFMIREKFMDVEGMIWILTHGA